MTSFDLVIFGLTIWVDAIGISVFQCDWTLRARLHQVSASMMWQLCNDARNTAFIENMESLENGLEHHFGVTPLLSMRHNC